MADLRRLRRRFGLLPVNKWAPYALLLLNLPDFVLLKRLAALLFVFNFGIYSSGRDTNAPWGCPESLGFGCMNSLRYLVGERTTLMLRPSRRVNVRLGSS